MGVIEDVERFVMQCPKYEKRRKIFVKDLCCVIQKTLDPHEYLFCCCQVILNVVRKVS